MRPAELTLLATLVHTTLQLPSLLHPSPQTAQNVKGKGNIFPPPHMASVSLEFLSNSLHWIPLKLADEKGRQKRAFQGPQDVTPSRMFYPPREAMVCTHLKFTGAWEALLDSSIYQ